MIQPSQQGTSRFLQFTELGRVVSIELNHKALEIARKGAEVCIKIEPSGGEAPKMFGRHFDETDILMSKVNRSKNGAREATVTYCLPFSLQVSRESIDTVKDHFREDMQKSDWQLMLELKKIFNIL